MVTEPEEPPSFSSNEKIIKMHSGDSFNAHCPDNIEINVWPRLASNNTNEIFKNAKIKDPILDI